SSHLITYGTCAHRALTNPHTSSHTGAEEIPVGVGTEVPAPGLHEDPSGGSCTGSGSVRRWSWGRESLSCFRGRAPSGPAWEPISSGATTSPARSSNGRAPPWRWISAPCAAGTRGSG